VSSCPDHPCNGSPDKRRLRPIRTCHDLTKGGYLVEGLDNEGKTPWRFNFKGKLADWTPEAIMEAATRR
jgi:hypothetical protein